MGERKKVASWVRNLKNEWHMMGSKDGWLVYVAVIIVIFYLCCKQSLPEGSIVNHTFNLFTLRCMGYISEFFSILKDVCFRNSFFSSSVFSLIQDQFRSLLWEKFSVRSPELPQWVCLWLLTGSATLSSWWPSHSCRCVPYPFFVPMLDKIYLSIHRNLSFCLMTKARKIKCMIP